MNHSRRITGSESRPCPRYCGVIVVDTEKFSKAPSSAMPQLSAEISDVLETAFHRAGLGDIWDGRLFAGTTGDGIFFGVPTRDIPFVIHPLLDTLQDVLEEHDRVLRVRNRDLRLRLRASVHLGPVPFAEGPHWNPISTPTIDTFRVADAPAVKELLKAADPDVTMLVAVLSQRVFEDIVVGGYTGIADTRFTPVRADVEDKEFARSAWVYIPRPSQRVGGAGTSRAQEKPDGNFSDRDGERDAKATIGGVFHGSVENAVTADRIFGGVTMGRTIGVDKAGRDE